MSFRPLVGLVLAAIWCGALSHGARAQPAPAPLATPPAAAAVPSRPNFLFVYTDDQRWDGMGVCQREEGRAARFPWIRTPNMDRLATEGVRFRNAFVVNSLCAPSRATFLTSQYSHLNGVANNHTPLPEGTVTHATLLRAAGYVTGYVGKWHMDGQRGQRPGFDYSASFVGQGRYDDCPIEINGEPTPTKGWVDDVTTGYAVDFLKKNQSKNFLLCVGFKSVHGPWEPAERYKHLYDGETAKPAPNADAPAIYRKGPAAPATRPTNRVEGDALPPGPDEAAEGKVRAAGKGNRDEMIRKYFSTLAGADEDLGRLLKTLDDLKLADNTMVIFTTDNGYYLGDHGLGDKRSAYEEAMRIPLIVRYPKLGEVRGTQCDAIALNLDLAPTLLDFAGVPVPPTMQGHSWRPLLERPAAPPADWRTSFFYEYFYEQGFAGTPTITAVRTVEAKLVKYPGHPEWSELFALTDDPIEAHNLFKDPGNGDLRKRMEEEFKRQSETVSYAVPPWADDPTKPERPKAGARRAVAGGVGAAAKVNGWVLDYRFDAGPDANPEAKPDGKVTDASGHDNAGSPRGGLPVVDGRDGRKARRFDGKAYVEVAKSPSLDPAEIPLAVEVTFRADKPGGILLARGGKTNGYSLYLDAAGHPAFTLNAANRSSTVAGPQPVGDGWVTLTAKLTADKQLALLVNGQEAARAPAKQFIPADPNDGMQIGADTGSPVVGDKDLAPFVGLVERVRIYSGDLPPQAKP